MDGWRVEWRVWRETDPTRTSTRSASVRSVRGTRRNLATDALHEDAGPLAERLADLQDVLGELQDGVVAEKRLTMLVRSGRLAGESAFAAGMVACLEGEIRSAARNRWPAAWEAARRKRLREVASLIPIRVQGLLAGTQH